MTDTDTIRARAFRLFEEGNYPACLDLIHTIPSHLSETRIRILEAVCLYSMGSLDEAEICLRDLKTRVPDSAEICLYLGKVLEKKGDDGARAEFADAVRLAPDHHEGIRRYARYLAGADDHRAAICLVKRLAVLTGDPDDLTALMKCLGAVGQADEGLRWYLQAGSPDGCFRAYIDLLMATGRYREIIEALGTPPCNTSENSLMLLYLEALSRVDPDQADLEYLSLLKGKSSEDLASRYVMFLSSRGLIREALGVWSTWLKQSNKPSYRLLGASLLESVSRPDQALALYQNVLFSGDTPDHPDLPEWFSSYRSLLVRVQGPESALDQMLSLVGPQAHQDLMIGAACWCEEVGRLDEAKSLFLQAFRSDLTTAGLAYAAYLGRTGESRERVKILGYILKTVRKIRDIEAVAREILTSPISDPDLLSLLRSCLSDHIPLLSLSGREIYAHSLCLSAESALENGSPDKALEFSLAGLVIVPVDSVRVAESLFALLVAAKSQVLPDYVPTLLQPASGIPVPGRRPEVSLSWLDPVEEAVVGYLRKHRVCHEMDLRKVAGTRRVAGLMNRIMRKAEEQGLHLAEKEGYSEFGEVYRYAGP